VRGTMSLISIFLIAFISGCLTGSVMGVWSRRRHVSRSKDERTV
jgi:hypothetical protein